MYLLLCSKTFDCFQNELKIRRFRFFVGSQTGLSTAGIGPVGVGHRHEKLPLLILNLLKTKEGEDSVRVSSVPKFERNHKKIKNSERCFNLLKIICFVRF